MRKVAGLLTEDQLRQTRFRAQLAIAPLKPGPGNLDSFDSGSRTEAGRELPPYYIVYFLLVELLGFQNLGREEKVDWSVSVEIDGMILFVEHRKFGVGVFRDGRAGTQDPAEVERAAREVVMLIKRAAKLAEPFFAHLAAEAVKKSELNVRNNSMWLLDRFLYAQAQFRAKLKQADANKDKRITKENKNSKGETVSWTISHPEHKLRQQVEWLGLAAIESFFGWTEHVFIHIAIITQKIKTGEEFEKLAFADWQTKAKLVIDLTNPRLKTSYDDLINIRAQIRNFMAHGAFGKSGEAFDFHSSAGAVPVRFSERQGRYALTSGKQFEAGSALTTIESFIDLLWTGPLQPAKLYIQDAELPLILTYASDGTYEQAMQSSEDMQQFVTYMSRKMDDAANMDW